MAGVEDGEPEMSYAEENSGAMARILDEKECKKTKQATKGSMKKFKQFCVSKKLVLDIENPSVVDLDKALKVFYFGVRKEKGGKYKQSGLNPIRFGIARHYLQTKGIDIINDPAFGSSNTMFKAVFVALKKEGLGCTIPFEAISPEELQHLYYGMGPDCKTHNALDINTPVGLQNKVFFDIVYFLCRRGQQNIRKFNTRTFEVKTDPQGKRYVYQNIDEFNKNHRENHNDAPKGRMYEAPGYYIF